MDFSSFGLIEPILRVLKESNYASPTPIQCKGIPPVLLGRDLLAAAQTGTGKTASYALPLLQRAAGRHSVQGNRVRVLVLAPTRELAVQIAEQVTHYGKYIPIKAAVVYGGVKINPQMMKLRGGVDFLVATPGRLLDLFRHNAVKFDQLETLVLDEADRILDLGFSDEINKLLALFPASRQTLLYSATYTDAVRGLAANILQNPLQLEVNLSNSVAVKVEQLVYEVDSSKKGSLLSHLIRSKGWQQALVFTRTKKGADRLASLLERDGISSAVIHGDKSQSMRSRALVQFKQKRARVLVATDVAARGIDITNLPYVVNFDLPKVAQDYIHRIGRTGRADCEGQAVSFVSADDVDLLSTVESLIGYRLQRQTEAKFEPATKVPISILRTLKPKKIKKNKQNKVANTDRVEVKAGAEKSRRGQKSAGSKKNQGRQGQGRNGQQNGATKGVSSPKKNRRR